MQEIKLFGRYMISPDNGRLKDLDILTNKKMKTPNGTFEKSMKVIPLSLVSPIVKHLNGARTSYRKKEMQTLDDYIKVIKEIDMLLWGAYFVTS